MVSVICQIDLFVYLSLALGKNLAKIMYHDKDNNER